MELSNFKVYRLGPIGAFDSSAHSIHQITLSHYFAQYGVDSYLYLRNFQPGKGRKELEEFLGLEFSPKLHLYLSVKHKGLSSLLNFGALLKDLAKNRGKENWVFVSKADHAVMLSKLKKLLNFRIVFENHQNKNWEEATKLSDLTLVVSPEVYEKVKELGRVKLWTYHYPVREEFFLKGKRLQRKERFTLCYAGSLNPEKGIETLLRAVRELPVELRVVGGNPRQVEEAKRVAERLKVADKVVFTGFKSQRELPAELSKADLLVAPFTKAQKTIPLKVYEYMATGIPVVSSEVEAVKVVAGELFNYFEPENPESLRKTLLSVISNPEEAQRKAEEAQKAARQFKWKRVMERIVSDLKEAGC